MSLKKEFSRGKTCLVIKDEVFHMFAKSKPGICYLAAISTCSLDLHCVNFDMSYRKFPNCKRKLSYSLRPEVWNESHKMLPGSRFLFYICFLVSWWWSIPWRLRRMCIILPSIAIEKFLNHKKIINQKKNSIKKNNTKLCEHWGYGRHHPQKHQDKSNVSCNLEKTHSGNSKREEADYIVF